MRLAVGFYVFNVHAPARRDVSSPQAGRVIV